MILCFELSMPSNNSGDGKWTGENKFYAIIKSFKTKKSEKSALKILDKGYFDYDFGDGWRAGISVKKVDSKEARNLRKRSIGFCGYNWMVDSIIDNLKILCKS